MKDEIKEILNKLQNYENYKFRSENGRKYKEIEAWEIELLLDYITNLQEENKVLLEKYSTIQILYNSSKSSIDETVKYLKIQIDDYKEELQKTEDEDVKLFCIHKIDTYNELLNILQGGGK